VGWGRLEGGGAEWGGPRSAGGPKSIAPPQRLFELRLGNVPGAVQVGIERERLGYAYGVRDLQCAAIGKSGRHDILGEIARGISGGAVDLCRVLAGEGAAAMRSSAALGVAEYLASGHTGIAIRCADHEASVSVHVEGGDTDHPAA